MQNKINYLDSIRGIACLIVVFSHISLVFFPQLHSFSSESSIPKSSILDFIHNSPFGFIYSGSAAVYCFFVLSGYVLSRSMLKKQSSLKNLVGSIIKRYPRLAIPSTVSCIVAFLFYSIDVNKSNISEWAFWIGNLDISLSSAIYNGAISPYIYGNSAYNWVLWTMQIEFIGSVFIYIYCFTLQKTSKQFILIMTVILLSVYIFSYGFDKYLFFGYFSFLLGMLLFVFDIKTPKLISYVLFIIGLYLSGVHYNSDSYKFLYESNLTPYIRMDNIYQILNFIGGSLVVSSIISGRLFNIVLNKKSLVWLGKLSFSIYLVHLPVTYLFGFSSFNLFYDSIGFFPSAILSSAIILIVTILLSIPFVKYVDSISIKVSSFIGNKL